MIYSVPRRSELFLVEEIIIAIFDDYSRYMHIEFSGQSSGFIIRPVYVYVNVLVFFTEILENIDREKKKHFHPS